MGVIIGNSNPKVPKPLPKTFMPRMRYFVTTYNQGLGDFTF